MMTAILSIITLATGYLIGSIMAAVETGEVKQMK